jgi:hypothetical protein
VGGPPLAVSPRRERGDLTPTTYPAPGDGDVNFWIPFSWPFSPGATSYSLRVGTAAGAGDVFDSGEILSTSVSVPQLPAGSYFARIGTNTAGTWSFRDFTFGSTGIPIATLVSPKSGSVLASGSTTFAWQAISGATAYRLLLGTSFGASNVLDSGVLAGNSVEVPAVSTGTPLYARLLTQKWGGWRWSDAVYSASTAYIPELVTPADGAANVDTGIPFEWEASAFSATFRLEIGSSPGANDLHDSGEIAVLKRFVGSLPMGKTLYGRISALFGEVWVPRDFTFTVRSNGSTAPQAVAAALWATDFVRGMADDNNVSYPDTPLARRMALQGLPAAFCTDYAAVLLDMLLQANVTQPAKWLNVCLKPNAYDCHTLVEFQDPLSGTWMLLDPTFDLTVRRVSDGSWASAWDVSLATQRLRFSDVSFMFLGSRGDSLARAYYLDYPLLYLNVYSDGAEMDPASALSSMLYFDPVSLPLPAPGPYALRSVPQEEMQVFVDGFATTLIGDPIDGMSYVFWASSIENSPGVTVVRPHRFVF